MRWIARVPLHRPVNRWDGGHVTGCKESNRVHIEDIEPIHTVVKTAGNAIALPIRRNIHLNMARHDL